MKNVSFLFPNLLLAVGLCIGCNKEDNSQVQNQDVYVAGTEIDDAQENSFATIWKNGKAQNLWSGGVANSIYVSKNNVYVVGWGFNEQGNRVAKIWKNGIVTNLTKGIDLWYNNDDANSVFVSGADVYVAGHERNEEGSVVATVWKNEKAEVLPYGVRANSVFVYNNDVYVAGSRNTGKAGIILATVWKNGEIYQTFTDETNAGAWGTIDARAMSVFVSGSDIYVLEDEKISNPYQHNVRVWKNGILLYSLGNESELVFAQSIFVSDNDVYVCGSENFIPKLWKNGIEQILSSGINYGEANSVYISGNDVYVVGKEGKADAQIWDAKLWINGKGKSLTNGKKQATPYSVYVVEKK